MQHEYLSISLNKIASSCSSQHISQLLLFCTNELVSQNLGTFFQGRWWRNQAVPLTVSTAEFHTATGISFFFIHSVRCMHAVNMKFINIKVGIWKKSKVLGLRCQKASIMKIMHKFLTPEHDQLSRPSEGSKMLVLKT